jgi:hypothetical protein
MTATGMKPLHSLKELCCRLLGLSGAPKVASMTSGRTWEQVPHQYQLTLPNSVNETTYVWDRDDNSVRAFFKCPRAGSDECSPYSIGIERVYYELAVGLEVPVCATYLESFARRRGLISIRAPGAKSWRAVDQDIIDSRATFVDRDKWPLAVVLDVLLGNPDRHEDNIFVQWDPPGHPPRQGEQCATWLIDFGHCGLWPPRKFDPSFAPGDVLRISDTAELTTAETNKYRNRLPRLIRDSFPPRGTAERAQAVEAVRQIAQNSASEAVRSISGHYFTTPERELTLRWVGNRIPRLDTLVDVVFPY